MDSSTSTTSQKISTFGLPDQDAITLSVVCAVYNGAHVIDGLLASYGRQARPDTELIVIDGGSTDQTLQKVRQSPFVNQVVSERDRGIYDAWNKALPLCRGTHVSFIGADDILACGALEALVHACQQATLDLCLIAGFNVLTRERIPQMLLGQPYVPGRLPYRLQMAHVMSAHSLAWLRRAGGFDASFRSAGDYELMLRERHTLKVQTLPVILAYMEDGGTSRRLWLPHAETYRARRKNGIGWLQAVAIAAKAVLGIGLRFMRLR